MTRTLIVIVSLAILLVGSLLANGTLGPVGQNSTRQEMKMGEKGPIVPNVKGYSEGQRILFLHTEASDPKVAKMLSDMMGSPVLVVASLAQAPDGMLANVYVFENGIKGDGPFGFQPDVFDNPPPRDAYSPLRRLNLISWKQAAAARELKAASEVREAEAKGEITVKRPGIVINMPMVTWPGGRR